MALRPCFFYFWGCWVVGRLFACDVVSWIGWCCDGSWSFHKYGNPRPSYGTHDMFDRRTNDHMAIAKVLGHLQRFHLTVLSLLSTRTSTYPNARSNVTGTPPSHRQEHAFPALDRWDEARSQSKGLPAATKNPGDHPRKLPPKLITPPTPTLHLSLFCPFCFPLPAALCARLIRGGRGSHQSTSGRHAPIHHIILMALLRHQTKSH